MVYLLPHISGISIYISCAQYKTSDVKSDYVQCEPPLDHPNVFPINHNLLLTVHFLFTHLSRGAFCGTRRKYLDSPLETFYWQNIKSAWKKSNSTTLMVFIFYWNLSMGIWCRFSRARKSVNQSINFERSQWSKKIWKNNECFICLLNF